MAASLLAEVLRNQQATAVEHRDGDRIDAWWDRVVERTQAH